MILLAVLGSLLPVILGHMKLKEWLTIKVLWIDERYFSESGEDKLDKLLQNLTLYTSRVKNPVLRAVLATILSNRKIITFYVKLIIRRIKPVTEQSKITKSVIISNAVQNLSTAVVDKIGIPVELLDQEVSTVQSILTEEENKSFIKGFANYNTKTKFTAGVEGVKYF